MPIRLVLASFLLVIGHHTLPTTAAECIDMDVYANEVVKCCRHEFFFTPEVSEKCINDLSREMPTSSNDFTVDCVHRAMGYVTDSNKIDVAKYVGFMEKFDTGYQMAATSAINHCATIQEDIRRDVETVNTKCSAFALLYYVCVAQLTTKNCPADRWFKGEVCDKVKMGIPPCN
uniref:Uncharacterized protein n=1 Tax=Anopheles maculatus TaxID=74869 RepID=A0A182S9V9_9DIPT